MIPTGPKVEEATRFGRIPFDLYALEHWNYDAPKETDAEQWRALGRSYLGMTSLERRPYHDKATSLRNKTNEAPHPKLTYRNIERVLKPFQTRKERHASELSGPRDPIWVQTCYDKALTDKECDLVFFGEVGVENGSSEKHMAFFDESVYDTGDDPDRLRLRLLERMPGLCDKRRSFYRENHGRSNRRIRDTLEGKSNRMATYVLFDDREALEQGFVKVMWLDDHGECLMITKVAPNEPSRMRTMFGEGFSMLEALETYGLDEEDGVTDREGMISRKCDDDGAGGLAVAQDISLLGISRKQAQHDSSHELIEETSESKSYKLGYAVGYADGLRIGMGRI